MARIFSWPTLLVGFVGSCGVLLGFWQDIRPYIFGPDLELRLTACDRHAITLSVNNSGGAPAVVRRPTFERFHEGRWESLPVQDFVERDPFEADKARIEPGDGYVLEYPSPQAEYFSAEVVASQPCPIRAHMAMDRGDGPPSQVDAICACSAAG